MFQAYKWQLLSQSFNLVRTSHTELYNHSSLLIHCRDQPRMITLVWLYVSKDWSLHSRNHEHWKWRTSDSYYASYYFCNGCVFISDSTNDTCWQGHESLSACFLSDWWPCWSLLPFVQHTHTFGGRSPVAFLIACPFGWHGSFKWHIVASEAMLIGRKLPPDQTRYICSLSHTQSSCQ